MSKAKKTIPYAIICLFSLIVFLIPFGNGDELWNYNFARNISIGMLPYKDFSIIQTPLSAYVSSLFVLTFGKGLISVRILGYIVFAAISGLTYNIIRSVHNPFISCVSIMFSMSLLILPYIYNYNYLSALLILIIIKIEEKEPKNRLIFNTFVGLLIGLFPLIKQNTGIMLLLGNTIICVLYLVLKREKIKVCITRVVASIIPGIVYLLYLFFTGTLSDFYEYAVLGIQTFIHRYSFIDLLVEAPVFGIIFLVTLSALIAAFIKFVRNPKVISKQQLNALILSIAWCSIAYPLCDGHHTLCIVITVVPTFLLYYPNKKTRKSENYICLFVASFVSFITIIYMMPIRESYHFSTLNNYEGVLITDTLENPIIETDDYIANKMNEGYCVRIADVSAAAINIPLETYEKNWDMLLVGNLGANTVEDLLKEDKKTLYLVSPREHDDLQEHRELILYIQNNYHKIDHIGRFDVYEK